MIYKAPKSQKESGRIKKIKTAEHNLQFLCLIVKS